MATHSGILLWEILWTEEPGGLQSMGLQRVGHDLVTKQGRKIFRGLVSLFFVQWYAVTLDLLCVVRDCFVVIGDSCKGSFPLLDWAELGVSVSGRVWVCLTVSECVTGCVWVCLTVWACLGVSECVWVCLTMSGHVWACLSVSGCVTGVSGCVWESTVTAGLIAYCVALLSLPVRTVNWLCAICLIAAACAS